MSQTVKSEIKDHLLFFISDEKIFSSILYELIKISPGRWFDIEELYRTSVKKLSHKIKIIIDVIKSIDELEYNDLTGQIRIRNLQIIEDLVNEKTVLFYGFQNEMNEEILLGIIESRNLTKLIVRFVKFSQLERKDFRPLGTILKNKGIRPGSVVVILKMSSRDETLEIETAVKNRFPNIKSCLAINNYFPNGCLSINQNTESPKPILSINESLNGFTLTICNYIYRRNEYSIILDHLIENKLKPVVYRNFTEFRTKGPDMRCIQSLEIPECYIGCFSIMTFNTSDDAKKAHRLIENIFDYLDIKPIEWFKDNIDGNEE